MPQERRPRISIALATFNGGKYLAEQLDSFLCQTRLPDELIVGDDNSSDETLALLDQFAADAPFQVLVEVNRPGLGPSVNFARTIARCTGDIVFLSDQDDRWHPDKIARMQAFLAGHPDCLVALHDAALMDGAGQPLGLTMGQQIAASGARPELGLVAGCCLAFDGRLARLYDQVPATATHDVWLTATADALGVRAYLPEPLIDYRRHEANVSQSYMSSARPASRWRRVAERVSRARAQPAAEALAAALADRASALAALDRHEAMLRQMMPAASYEAGIAALKARVARDSRRLAVHRANRAERPRLMLQGLRQGDYSGTQGLLSLARDLVDAVRT